MAAVPLSRTLPLHVLQRGCLPYQEVWREMRDFTAERDEHTVDQCWLLEHTPVFTLGLNGKSEHLLAPGDIPVVQTDRGGQVTYHGPGQLVVYLLLDLRRRGIGVQQLVRDMERAVIDWLRTYGVEAAARRAAPGVYVDGAKLASLGLRVRRGCCYHGLALNVDLDLEPFSRINPCGYAGMAVTRLVDLGIDLDVARTGAQLQSHLAGVLGYTIEPFRQDSHVCTV